MIFETDIIGLHYVFFGRYVVCHKRLLTVSDFDSTYMVRNSDLSLSLVALEVWNRFGSMHLTLT